ncbi:MULTISPECIES: V-type ATP synthase subunit D [Mogibacterium]|uniref:V-type ATP synthase subunit D n=1 Tax=Mogibacterium timidum TaxID=35519 RepID=A0A7Y8VRT6_9FIRM|nr:MULTISPECIES: V-type ATP synthase subunit D [Mogibacterium]EJU21235.1 putative V-type sodium ATPase, D subunit [Mogibacterium sp. CM50]NWO23486.1 V-type ATP synthase subunit D [Mogibacterium timidum]
MARLNVNPTRMVMSKLKGQLKVAIKGHKLMKDKRDELMRIFLDLAREIRALREEIEPMLEDVYGSFSVARAVMTPEMLEEALMYPKQSVKLVATEKNVMSVDVPSFDFEQENTQTGSVYPYGFATTSGELDKSIEKLSELFPKLLRLAGMEKEAMLIADEIEKTRRRVNALEYVKIPDYQETIKYIKMKLDENERGNQTRLMKVKDMILHENIEQQRAKDEEMLASLAE